MRIVAACALICAAGSAFGQFTPDGTITAGEWGPAVSVQDTPTGFGNSNGADQGSPFGSELNAAFGTITGGNLEFAITGNLEANFNKFFIFIDGVAGGENTLAGDNADGGFGEINNIGALTFDSGFEPDHGIRIEIGDGFFGVNTFDLIDNSAVNAISGGGPGDLPVADLSGGAINSFSWNNANPNGVTDTDAADALTATTGWEFSIDLAALLGEVPSSVKISAFITSGGGDFLSNQFLGGVGGAGNLGGGGDVRDLNQIDGNQFFTIVPAPGAVALFGAAGLAGIRRRR